MGKDEKLKMLLETIDFFSQNLHFDQITSYGYEFIHDALELDKSCIFVLKENHFSFVRGRNCSFKEHEIPYTEKHKEIATRYGRVISDRLDRYFSESFLEEFEVNTIVPLLVRDELIGFITTNTLTTEMNGHDDSSIHAINQLINNSLEIATRYNEMKDLEKQLDRKIFNLFFINHSTKVLLSELNLDNLYQLCIDIIRELTASAVTSFGLYDPQRDKIVLKGYNDIISFKKYYAEIGLKTKRINGRKIVLHVENDKAILEELFEDIGEFERLQAEYVVLLVKDEIIGFVTIGKSVSNMVYDAELFDQIKSMASSIYISIVNAQYFGQITAQKEDIQKKLDTIENMVKAVKNINSCDSIGELCEITMSTMEYGFGFESAFIALNEKSGYRVVESIGFNENINDLSGFIVREFDELYYEFTGENIRDFIDDRIIFNVNDPNCFVVAPIMLESFSVERSNVLGYLVVLKTTNPMNKMQPTIVDMIGNSISPVINQLIEAETIKREYIPNEKELFLGELNEALKIRQEFFIDFTVYYKVLVQKPFEEIDLSEFEGIRVRYFDNMVLYISNEALYDTGFDGVLEIEDLDDFKKQIQKVF